MINLETVKPENFWYFVGYMATDENLSKDERHLNITSKDRSHLFKIKKCLGLSNKVGLKRNGSSQEKKYSQIQFGDVEFYRYLLSIGFKQRKSLDLKEIKIDRTYFKDFLRGVIDGDGNISTWVNKSNDHVEWSLRIVSASRDFSTWLKNMIETEYLVNGKLYEQFSKERKNPIFIIKFGKLAAKVILQNIYYENCLCLKRKKEQYLRCLKDKNKMIKYGAVISPGGGIARHEGLKIL